MYLKTMKLKNFRCYDELDVNFNPDYTVLVGVNGAGKSSLLDAVATAMGSYIAGFDGIPSNGIISDDAHRKMYELGSRIDAEAQFPVEIDVTGSLNDKDMEWSRSLQGVNGRTIITGAKSIMEYAASLQNKVREGNKETILPLIAYYGTGRLYIQKKQKRNSDTNAKFTRTSGYIDCLDSASNDKLMMKWFEQMTSIQIQEGVVVPELEVVKKAMGMCYAGVHNQDNIANFEYKMKTHEIEITYEKNGNKEKLPMKMLSDGLRSTISMVADIAYRMAVLNPQLLSDALTNTPGIVLIDEVDMHLHPEWQKRIMEDLHYIFPQIQFIVTTHAPSILVNIKREHLLLLDNYKVYVPDNNTYGRDVSAVMNEMMKAEVRPLEVLELKNKFYQQLADEQYLEAKISLDKLTDILGDDDADVVEAKVSYDVEQL
ncbi:MAG: AAA family ATPase [Eubacteriales bacterium]